METSSTNNLTILNVIPSPYSLGKLIEWKQDILLLPTSVLVTLAPYSLGKLIEWKLALQSDSPRGTSIWFPFLPTR
jgi:hypothetical protein